MSKWQIHKLNNEISVPCELNVIKEYPFKIQAVIWCFMHGYVTSGGYGSNRFYSLDPKIKIVEVKNAR